MRRGWWALIESNRFQYLYVRVRPGYVSATLALMQRQMQQFYPEQPFQYAFLDETIHTLYQSEERLGKIFTCFAVLAILIACLGIFGLATYSAQQRIREIGIRKVLGASVVSIFTLLSTDFLQLVLLANVIGWPLSWWAMNCWLDDFAYHIRIGWWVFAVAAVLALLIALITVSFQAIKAAIANPLKSLRTH